MENKIFKICSPATINQTKTDDMYIVLSERIFQEVLKESSEEKTILLIIDDLNTTEKMSGIVIFSKGEGHKHEKSYNNQISEFKKHSDPKWKNQVKKNFDQAILKRGKDEMVKKIAEEWDSSKSAVYKTIKGEKGDILAQDILILEDKFGIHRDEILGIPPENKNRRIYDNIEEIIKKFPDDELEIKAAVRELIKALRNEIVNGNPPNLSALAKKVRDLIKENI
jgi:hypothetical protein